VRSIDPLEHPVDALREIRYLSLACGTREARAQLRRADRACFRGNALERLQSLVNCVLSPARRDQCRQREQQSGGCHEDSQRDKIGLPACDYVEIELPHHPM